MEENKSNDNGSVSVPLNNDNPLLRKLSPKQFDASVKFYEADHALNGEDREQLSQDLQTMVTKTSLTSYGLGSLAFFTPTLIKKFQKVPNFPKKSIVHKPFISFVIGLGTMVASNQIMSKYQFESKISQLSSSGNKTQLSVWKAMDYHQATLFYLYYRRTSQDPSYIVKDPRAFSEKTMNEVHYNPPMRKKNQNSVLGRDQEEIKSPDQLSHWDKIRIANGFQPPIAAEDSTTNLDQETTEESVESAIEDESSSTYSDTKESKQSQPKSAWDKVRQGK